MTELVPCSSGTSTLSTPEMIALDENWVFTSSGRDHLRQLLRASRRSSPPDWSDLQRPLRTDALIQRMEDFGYEHGLSTTAGVGPSIENSLELMNRWRPAANPSVAEHPIIRGAVLARMPNKQTRRASVDLPDIGDGWLDD